MFPAASWLGGVGREFRVVLTGMIELVKGPEADGVRARLEAAPEERLLGSAGAIASAAGLNVVMGDKGLADKIVNLI